MFSTKRQIWYPNIDSKGQKSKISNLKMADFYKAKSGCRMRLKSTQKSSIFGLFPIQMKKIFSLENREKREKISLIHCPVGRAELETWNIRPVQNVKKFQKFPNLAHFFADQATGREKGEKGHFLADFRVHEISCARRFWSAYTGRVIDFQYTIQNSTTNTN